jgi:hypothetical protein
MFSATQPVFVGALLCRLNPSAFSNYEGHKEHEVLKDRIRIGCFYSLA